MHDRSLHRTQGQVSLLLSLANASQPSVHERFKCLSTSCATCACMLDRRTASSTLKSCNHAAHCALCRAGEGLQLLPGIKKLLLELQTRSDVQVALVTGNLAPIGWAKMEALGVKDSFSQPPFGGFGSDTCSGNLAEVWRDRGEMIAIAQRKAQGAHARCVMRSSSLCLILHVATGACNGCAWSGALVNVSVLSRAMTLRCM